jgi:AcrR family transcriptional regulator
MRDSQPERKATEGLRERKRRQTRVRLANAAMALFLERGFEATTVEDIAATEDVSKRSFFDYFPAKEDVVSAWQDDFGAALAAAVAARPAHEPLATVVEDALTSSIVAAASPQAMAIDQLVRTTPALRARDQLKYNKLEQTLADALSRRVKGKAGQLRARLLAMLAVGGLRVGSEEWYSQGRTGSAKAYTRMVFRMHGTGGSRMRTEVKDPSTRQQDPVSDGAIAVICRYHYHAALQLTPRQSWIWIRRGRALSSNGTVISSTPSRIFAVSFSVLTPSGRGTVV